MTSRTYPSQMADQYVIRFADGLRERIRQAAAESGRSMNAELNYRLEASFKGAVTLHPEIAALLDQHIEIEVAARLRAVAETIANGGQA